VPAPENVNVISFQFRIHSAFGELAGMVSALVIMNCLSSYRSICRVLMLLRGLLHHLYFSFYGFMLMF